MVSASFIFRPTDYDEEFHHLNDLIDQAAKAIDGYIGRQSWKNSDGLHNSIYYWNHQAALKIFAQHPKHIEAKQKYKRWYEGFHVVISEVIASYGDGNIAHITPNVRNQELL